MTAARDERVPCRDVLRAALHEEPVAAGEPATAALALARLGAVEVGLWEMSAGEAHDVEADELFVVLSGRATLSVERPAGRVEVVELAPGSAVRLAAGERTLWTVHETLRKIYVTTL